MSNNIIPLAIENNITHLFKSIRMNQSTKSLSVNEFEIFPPTTEFKNDVVFHTIKINAIFEHKKYNEIFKKSSQFMIRLRRYFLVQEFSGKNIDKNRVKLELIVKQVQSC